MDTPVAYQAEEFDEDGFLKDSSHWNEDVARTIARHDGLAVLTDDHWAIIRTLRDHYFRCGTIPWMRHICHENHLGDHCVDDLFAHSSREAWRVAGLPNPGEEAKAYMN